MSDSANTNDTSGPIPERLVRPHPGQPTKLTEELIAEYIRLLPTCMYLDQVSEFLGIHRSTAGKWYKRGRETVNRMRERGVDTCAESEAIYVQFFYAHKKAMAAGELKACHVISKASETVWQAGAWILERRFPDRYGSNSHDIREAKKGLEALGEKVSAMQSQTEEVATLRADMLAKEAEMERVKADNERLKAMLAQSTTPDHVIGR